MTKLLYKLGQICVQHRRWVLSSWIFLAAVTITLAILTGGETSDTFEIPNTESQQASNLLENRFPEQGGSSARMVFAIPDRSGENKGTLDSPENRNLIERVLTDIATQPHVIKAPNPLESPPGPPVVSPDSTIAFSTILFDIDEREVGEEGLERLDKAAEVAREGGLLVQIGGDVPRTVSSGPGESHTSELIGLSVAVLVLLIAFGSLLAMGMPIITAIFGLGIGLSGISLLAAVTDVSSAGPTLATMIGLAVGIDYALFVVTRHRENLNKGMTIQDAAALANATAGGAVIFAGITVIIAISGLALVGIPFVTAMGFASAITVAVAVAVAITLLPALFGFVGRNIDRFGVPGIKSEAKKKLQAESKPTLSSRWAQHVTQHPWRFLLAGLLFMGILAIPMVDIRLGMPSDATAPASTSRRVAYDLIVEGFGPGFNGPLVIVADLQDVADIETTLEEVRTNVLEEDGVRNVSPARLNPAGDTAVLFATPATAPNAEETEDLVEQLRSATLQDIEDATGAHLALTGSTAVLIDMSAKISDALPLFIGAVVALSFFLLMMVFRSVLVPLKAAIAILLSIGSSYGVIVAIFQWGWLKDLIGLEETIPILSFLPMMMFAILFGLSMDYEVFILSRIHEEYLTTGNPKYSVLTGLAESARVITAAALIMISVFGSFILGDDATIKMFGIGLSVAVFLDATVVRMVIVPAVMILLDRAAWWMPRWLDKILPNLQIEGGINIPTAYVPQVEPGYSMPVVGTGLSFPASSQQTTAVETIETTVTGVPLPTLVGAAGKESHGKWTADETTRDIPILLPLSSTEGATAPEAATAGTFQEAGLSPTNISPDISKDVSYAGRRTPPPEKSPTETWDATKKLQPLVSSSQDNNQHGQEKDGQEPGKETVSFAPLDSSVLRLSHADTSAHYREQEHEDEDAGKEKTLASVISSTENSVQTIGSEQQKVTSNDLDISTFAKGKNEHTRGSSPGGSTPSEKDKSDMTESTQTGPLGPANRPAPGEISAGGAPPSPDSERPQARMLLVILLGTILAIALAIMIFLADDDDEDEPPSAASGNPAANQETPAPAPTSTAPSTTAPQDSPQNSPLPAANLPASRIQITEESLRSGVQTPASMPDYAIIKLIISLDTNDQVQLNGLLDPDGRVNELQEIIARLGPEAASQMVRATLATHTECVQVESDSSRAHCGFEEESGHANLIPNRIEVRQNTGGWWRIVGWWR